MSELFGLNIETIGMIALTLHLLLLTMSRETREHEEEI